MGRRRKFRERLPHERVQTPRQKPVETTIAPALLAPAFLPIAHLMPKPDRKRVQWSGRIIHDDVYANEPRRTEVID